MTKYSINSKVFLESRLCRDDEWIRISDENDGEDLKPIRDTIERELSLLSIHFGNCETSPTFVSVLTPLSAPRRALCSPNILVVSPAWRSEEQSFSGKTSLIICVYGQIIFETKQVFALQREEFY